jgi:HK97 family phage portal protein
MKILAETESSLPFSVYERTADGTQPASNHPVHELLHDAPNPEMSAMDFRMSQTAQLALWGNCYSRIARNVSGQVIALWPLQSRLMQVKRDSRGELLYSYNAKTSIPQADPACRTLSFDGINGISPIAQLSNPVGLAMALEEYASGSSNGAIPAIALEHPKTLSPKSIENIRGSFKGLYGGLENAHEVAVAEEGMQIKVLGTDPQKSQSIESRRFQIGEIARIYRIPLHLLGDLERATFSNIEQQSLEFVTYTLMPWLEIWEQAVNRSLFTPAERRRYFCEHNVAGLLRGDLDSRYRAYATGRQWGWLSVDDIRRLENMNAIGQKAGGDAYLVPLNMADAKWLADGSMQPNKPGTPDPTGTLSPLDAEAKAPQR